MGLARRSWSRGAVGMVPLLLLGVGCSGGSDGNGAAGDPDPEMMLGQNGDGSGDVGGDGTGKGGPGGGDPGAGDPNGGSPSVGNGGSIDTVEELQEIPPALEPGETLEPEQLEQLEPLEEALYEDVVDQCDPCQQGAECSPDSVSGDLAAFDWISCDTQEACGTCEIILTPELSFTADRHNITVLADGSGISVEARLRIPTAAGELVLFGVDASLYEDEDGVHVYGTTFVPAPSFGFLEAVEIEDPARATIGYDLGSNIADVGVPLQPDRHYFYFTFSTGFAASAGPVSFSAPGGSNAVFVLDPADPFFFISGSVFGSDDEDGPPKNGDGSKRKAKDDQPSDGESGEPTPTERDTDESEQERQQDDEEQEQPEASAGSGDYGFGISMTGLVPFVPHTTWGLEDFEGVEEGFDGHLVQTGTIPMGKLPMELRGLLITDLDPDEDGATPFHPEFYTHPDLRLGGNGDLFLSVPFLKFLKFEWFLGQSSVSAAFGDLKQAYLSGVLEPDDPSTLFPPGLPIGIESSYVNVAGFISEDEFADSFLRAEGEYVINPLAFAQALGIDVSAVRATRAEMNLDKDGLWVWGQTESKLHAFIDFDQEQELELYIAADGLSSYLELRGALLIAGVGLKEARSHLGGDGLIIDGTLTALSQELQMGGSVTAAGPELHGGLVVRIPFSHVDIGQLVSLLAQIEEETQLLATLEAQAEADAENLRQAQRDVDAAKGPLDDAQEEVDRIDYLIADVDGNISRVHSDIDYWENRSCGSYSGCPSCSGCGSCGALDVICGIELAACETARVACLGARETCYAANFTACETERAANITALGLELGVLETEKAGLVVARETASVALDAAKLTMDGAVLALQGAEAAAEASADAWAATQDGLDLLQEEADNLPPILEDFEGRVGVQLATNGLTGEISGEIGGHPIAGGRVTFGASPQACFSLPADFLQGTPSPGEFCASL